MDLHKECNAMLARGYKCNMTGKRRTDPNSDLPAIGPNGPNFPPYTRVYPVIDWSYDIVWEYLRAFNVAYCPLYDQGYTSLGEVHNSIPNPALLNPDGETYRPAW